MANTYLHKEHCKVKKGLVLKTSEKYNRQCDRHNYEVGERRHLRNKLREKILNASIR